jgi:hypothetical protein
MNPDIIKLLAKAVGEIVMPKLDEIRQDVASLKSSEQDLRQQLTNCLAEVERAKHDLAEQADASGAHFAVTESLNALVKAIQNNAASLTEQVQAMSDEHVGLDKQLEALQLELTKNVQLALASASAAAEQLIESKCAELAQSIPVIQDVELPDFAEMEAAIFQRCIDSIPQQAPADPIVISPADFTVLPAIDFTKAYPRGTYARHAGGLWKAHSDTSGERGWECLWNGLADIAIDMPSEREFTIGVQLSNGERVERSFAIPVVLDQGVYKQGASYVRGDGVSYGGCFWIAKCDTSAVPGRDNDDWRLSVKKGRDARRVSDA